MSARRWIDTAVHALLCMVGVVGLATGFSDAGWLLAGGGGLVIGAAGALLAARLRLGALLTLALSLVLYVLAGSALAVPEEALWGVLPTGRSLSSLAVGAVWGWADLLTLRAPVDLPDYVTVVPYVACWAIGLIGTTLAVRWLPRHGGDRARAAVLLAGPLALYLASLLLGTEEPFLPGVRGVAFGAIALVWLGWRRAGDQALAATTTTGLRRRLAGAAALLAATVAVGALTGAAVVPPAESRFVLRERIQPPFEPLEFPSPLAGFREYSKLLEDETIFIVDGLQEGERLRLATMDAYDGRLWSVAGSTVASDGSGRFSLVGAELPPPPLAVLDDPRTVTVEVRAYDDVWIPSIGYLDSLDLLDRDRAAREALRYNPATGSAVLTGGLREGDRIRLVAEPQEVGFADEELLDVPTARIELAPVTVVPDVVAAAALEFAGAAESPIEQLRAIEQTLQTTGFFSRGTASDSAPSVAGHGADRMEDLLTREAMVGDEEQYASVFALMARSLGHPARVVLGFAPDVRGDGPVEVSGRDVTAWVEVPFEGIGWIPFFPTPDRTDVPQDQTPKPQTEPQPQVRQPPRTQSEQDDLISAVEIEEDDADDESLFAIPGWLLAVGGAVLIPAAIVLVPALAVAAAKRRRVRRRRAGEPHDAVAGAWDELVDRCAELGYDVPARATRSRTAAALERQAVGAAVLPLARDADAAVFAGEAVAAERAEQVWRSALEAADAAARSLPRRRVLLSRYRLRSLADRWRSLADRVSRTMEPAS